MVFANSANSTSLASLANSTSSANSASLANSVSSAIVHKNALGNCETSSQS